MNTKLVKKLIREEYLSIREALSPEYRTAASELICNEIIKSNEYKSASLILLYFAIKSEVSLDALFTRALEDGKTVAFPKCQGDRALVYYEVNSYDDFQRGRYSIMEPKANLKRINDFDGALCVIPAVTVDMSGVRIGYGGGYYDRFMQQNKNLIRVCVCFDAQVSTKPLPVGIYDEKYQRLITDRRKVFL